MTFQDTVSLPAERVLSVAGARGAGLPGGGVPAAAAVVLLSAMVFAAPLPVAGKAPVAQAPDRAAAYLAASAD